jgi:hypothetical protein
MNFSWQFNKEKREAFASLSFVTSKVEKSNFYEDLNTLIDWKRNSKWNY